MMVVAVRGGVQSWKSCFGNLSAECDLGASAE